MIKKFLFIFIYFLLLTSCSPVENNSTVNTDLAPSVEPSIRSVFTPTVAPTAEASATFTLTATLKPAPTPTPTEHPGWLPEGALIRHGRGAFYEIASSPDESLVAIAAEGGVYMTDPLTGRIMDFLETEYAPLDVAFSPIGNRLFIGLALGGTQIWTSDKDGTWQVEKTMPNACGNFIKVSPDGNTLLAKCFGKQNSSFTAWDLTTGQQIFNLGYKLKYTNVFAMDFSPIDPSKAVYARGNIIALLDIKTGKDLKRYTETKAEIITDLDYSPDGKTIVVCPNKSEVILLNAETLEEIGRNPISSDVRMLSFMDDNSYIALTSDSYVLQKVNGEQIHRQEFWGFPMHAYLPQHKIIVLASERIEYIDQQTFGVIARIEGFKTGHWFSQTISGNGDSIIFALGSKKPDLFFSSITKPDQYTYLDINRVCSDADWWAGFVDSQGQYLYVKCPKEKKIVVVDRVSLQEKAQYELPISMTYNTDTYLPSRKDNEELSALIYQASESNKKEYRVDIWKLVKHELVSQFTVENVYDEKPTLVGFSSTRKYLALKNNKNSQVLIYDTADGRLVQTIKVTLQDTKVNDYPVVSFINNETMVMIRKGKTVEIVSIETGKPVVKYLNLKNDTPVFIEETDCLVTYSYRTDRYGGFYLLLDYYSLDSNKVQESVVVEVIKPVNEKTDNTYSCNLGRSTSAEPVYFLPNGNGKKASVFITCTSSSHAFDYTNLKSFKTIIALIDIENKDVKKTYTYYPDFTWFYNLYYFGEKMYTVNDNYIFVWDIHMD